MSGQIAREPARKLALGALCLVALALTGCMPAHRAPPALAGLDIPQGWTAPQHPTLSADTRIGAQWWRSFGDAALDRHVEAALARGGNQAAWPHLVAYRQRMQARPAYQRALDKGGPVLMQT